MFVLDAHPIRTYHGAARLWMLGKLSSF